MDHREHIQNMLDGAAKNAQKAVDAHKLTGQDATNAAVAAHLDALDGCRQKVLAKAIDQLVVESGRLRDEKPSASQDDTTATDQ